MSFPNIPNVTPDITISRFDVENLLLASIAFEELGLAHIINSEAEKIQYVLGTLPSQTPPTPPTFDDLLAIDKSAEMVLRDVIKKEMLLQFKLEDVINIIPTPSIRIDKFISVDGGATYQKAEVAPFPTLPAGVNPMFKYVITNTGNVTLKNVAANDSVLGTISLGGTLDPGASLTITRTGAHPTGTGTQTNTATATGTYQTQTVQDTDNATYNF